MERSRAGAEIVQAVTRGLARDPKTLPKLDRDRRNGGGGATVELLKVLLRQVSEGHGVAAKMIATVDDLEAIAGDDPCRRAGADRLAARPLRRQGPGTEARPPCAHARARQGHRAGMAGAGRASLTRCSPAIGRDRSATFDVGKIAAIVRQRSVTCAHASTKIDHLPAWRKGGAVLSFGKPELPDDTPSHPAHALPRRPCSPVQRPPAHHRLFQTCIRCSCRSSMR